MYLAHLALHDFRNYKQLDLTLGSGLYLFYGENAQGKTNLLEAVAMLATSNSFHATSDREIVNWQAPDHVARIAASVERHNGEVKIEIVVIDPTPAGGANFSMPESRQRKRVKINDVPKKPVDLVGQVTVVLFAPTDLRLVDGSPEERRRFLDRGLCQMQPRYCSALVKYRKVITQRSALLKRIRENQEDPRLLDYLDEKLTEWANLIIFERQRMVASLNAQVDELQSTISGGREHLQIVYRPSFAVNPGWNTIESLEHYREQLREARRKETYAGVCLLGPHRDDLEFLVNGVNMLTYGSRGQQRTVALSAKLAELAYMRDVTGEEPILLLDDVFSELDSLRREYLLRQILQHDQVLITATDFTDFPQEILTKAHRYQVVNGEIKEA
ncbi:MAG TPA: DNA replication/repair protein RecF [Ktedonobacteraceae bacterium]|jgi:DNA replication and repair protein RecF|nr:DNA replication/repair protein RecF [Ktedonobacteraceae bacterium]